MALIKCPECGHQISEYAEYCINCGCPMSVVRQLLNKRADNYEKEIPSTEHPTSVQIDTDFHDACSPADEVMIDVYFKEIKKLVPQLEKEWRAKMVAFLIKHKGESYSLCWFRKDNDKLVFRYYVGTKNKENVITSTPTLSRAETTANSVYKYFKNNFYPDSDYATPTKESTSFYELLRDKFVNGRVVCESKTEKIIEDVYSFVKKASTAKSIYNGSSFYTIYSICGKEYYMYSVTENDAKYFYQLYKAEQIINIIKYYESEVPIGPIITNPILLRDDLLKMFNNNSSNFHALNGIDNTTFIIVPIQKLTQKLNELTEYEKKTF